MNLKRGITVAIVAIALQCFKVTGQRAAAVAEEPADVAVHVSSRNRAHCMVQTNKLEASKQSIALKLTQFFRSCCAAQSHYSDSFWASSSHGR